MDVPAELEALAFRTVVEHEDRASLPVALGPRAEALSSAFVLAFRDGPLFEPADAWGAAHFLEHALFRGTARWPSQFELARAVESVGGRVSAWSTRDAVQLFVKVPAGAEPRALEVLDELLHRPLLDPAALEAEGAVVDLERRREGDAGAPWAASLLECALLAPDPVARHPVASRAAVAALDAGRLRAHLERSAVRGNVTLAAAGALQGGARSRVGALAETFLPGAARAPAAFAVQDPLDGAPACVVAGGSRSQAHLAVGWRFPLAPEGAGLPAWRVLNSLLGSGYTSLLNATLREREGLTYLCQTSLASYRGVGLFKVACTVPSASLGRALAAIARVVDDVAAGRVPDALVEEALSRHAAHVLLQQEDSLELARLLAGTWARGEAPFSFPEYLRGLESVTPEAVSGLARADLAPGGRRVVVVSGDPGVREALPGALLVERGAEGEVFPGLGVVS